MADLSKKFLPFEYKVLSDDGEFSGIASTYGNLDHGGDIVERGAFTATLAEQGAERPLLWQHDARSPIGLVTLRDSDAGLLVEKGRLELALDEAKKALTLVKSGIVRGLSIGFEALKWEWKRNEDPNTWPARIIKEARLWEVSLVTFPMNDRAQVTAVKSLRDFEAFLRDAGGFSKREAAVIASRGYKALSTAAETEPEEDAGATELLAWLKDRTRPAV